MTCLTQFSVVVFDTSIDKQQLAQLEVKLKQALQAGGKH